MDIPMVDFNSTAGWTGVMDIPKEEADYVLTVCATATNADSVDLH